jgi:hypothetical protein
MEDNTDSRLELVNLFQFINNPESLENSLNSGKKKHFEAKTKGKRGSIKINNN